MDITITLPNWPLSPEEATVLKAVVGASLALEGETEAPAVDDLLARRWDPEPACLIHDTAGEDVLGWEMADCTCPPPSQPNFSTRRSQ